MYHIVNNEGAGTSYIHKIKQKNKQKKKTKKKQQQQKKKKKKYVEKI